MRLCLPLDLVASIGGTLLDLVHGRLGLAWSDLVPDLCNGVSL